MKNVIFILTVGIVGMLATTACNKNDTKSAEVQSNLTTSEMKVYGQCGMCEKRIESAVLDIEGVQSGDWIVETKMLTVAYDDQKVSLDDIHKRVAQVGHDTEKIKAEDEIYSSLPKCCLYDRS